jgi:hypothetical protein
MAQERLTLRKTRGILRLKEEVGLSNRAIARVCKISNSTVGEYLKRAEAAGLHWPLPEGLNEDELYQKLFPENNRGSNPERLLPNWEAVRQELKKKGVTLRLLWIEYREQHPDGYGYTQFCEYYRNWAKSQSPTGRFPHKGGEVMEVDSGMCQWFETTPFRIYALMTMSIFTLNRFLRAIVFLWPPRQGCFAALRIPAGRLRRP